MENKNNIIQFPNQKAIDDRASHLSEEERTHIGHLINYWGEKEEDAYRAYEYARGQREALLKKIGAYVMPRSHIDTLDSEDE